MSEPVAETPNAAISVIDVRKLFEDAAVAPRRTEELVVPRLGKIHVQGLRASEFDDYEAACVTEDGKRTKASRAVLVRHSVVTPDGKKVFRDDHIPMLEGLDAAIINPIAKKAMDLCGLSATEVEKIEGN